MTADQLIADIAALPVDDRLRIVQAIWDSLPADAGVGLSPEQQEELDHRMERYREDPTSTMSLEQLKDRLGRDRVR